MVGSCSRWLLWGALCASVVLGGCLSPPPGSASRPPPAVTDAPAVSATPERSAAGAPLPAAEPAPGPTPPSGRIPGKKNHPEEFVRPAAGGCRCAGNVDMQGCRCIHCGHEPGSVCYCDQGRPTCLCGLDMPKCRCTHCAGREGGGVCPCDHDKTREELERKRRERDG